MYDIICSALTEIERDIKLGNLLSIREEDVSDCELLKITKSMQRIKDTTSS